MTSFSQINFALSHAIKNIVPDHKLCFTVDTSSSRIGAAFQHINADWKPIFFFSHKFTLAETRCQQHLDMNF